MVGALELLRTIARAPLRTMRYRDLQELGTNTWRQLDDLVDRGALLRIAQGVYTAPPDGRDGRTWRPGLESAGLAVATARHGTPRRTERDPDGDRRRAPLGRDPACDRYFGHRSPDVPTSTCRDRLRPDPLRPT